MTSMTDSLDELKQQLQKMHEALTVSRREKINARPRDKEIPDPIPVALPVGMETPATMRELVQEYVEGAMSTYAASHKLGTFEEEDDFEEEDPELLPMSQFEITEYEMVDEPGPPERAAEKPPEEAAADAPAEPAPETETPVDKP